MTITKVNHRQGIHLVRLNQDMIWKAEGDLRGEHFTCTAGKLWLTQHNDPTDHILRNGESFWVTHSGTVVVQALQDGQFTFSRINRPHYPGTN